jgi:hypothetical protein
MSGCEMTPAFFMPSFSSQHAPKDRLNEITNQYEICTDIMVCAFANAGFDNEIG